MTEDEELENSALKIQSIARGRKARRGNRRKNSRKSTEEELAAAKLQSMQRGKLSRQRVAQMKEERKAAGRIQAIHRGRSGRRTVAAKRSGGLELQLKDVRRGLSQMARNPFTLKHSFVRLGLSGCDLRSIGVLARFPNLQFVDLSGNNISDLSPLADVKSLLTLDVSKNNLKQCLDYDVPVCSPDRMFALGDDAIGSVLHEANFSCNVISEIRDLSQHRFLHHLDLSFNYITKIEGVEGLGMLQTLNLSNNMIETVENLDGLPIITLDVGSNRLSAISNVDKLPRLETIIVRDNKISRLSGLRSCLSLRSVDAGNNSISVIREVSFLSSIGKLCRLTLAGNPCCEREFYRRRVLARLEGIVQLDGIAAGPEEKVKAVNLYGGEFSDLSNRKVAWKSRFPNREFVDFLRPFREDEEDVVGIEDEGGSFVRGMMEEAIKNVEGRAAVA